MKRIPPEIHSSFNDKIACLRDHDDWLYLAELFQDVQSNPHIGYFDFKQMVYLVLNSPESQMPAVVDLLKSKYDR